MQVLQVKPYYFDFVCSVKKRWLGRTIIDVFSEVKVSCLFSAGPFTHATRWEARAVSYQLTVKCVQEFASRPRSYYKEAFADGRLRIEGGKGTATAETPLHGSHRMRHFIHRHEPPVLDLPIQVCNANASHMSKYA